jgi:hypothetical protein
MVRLHASRNTPVVLHDALLENRLLVIWCVDVIGSLVRICLLSKLASRIEGLHVLDVGSWGSIEEVLVGIGVIGVDHVIWEIWRAFNLIYML